MLRFVSTRLPMTVTGKPQKSFSCAPRRMADLKLVGTDQERKAADVYPDPHIAREKPGHEGTCLGST